MSPSARCWAALVGYLERRHPDVLFRAATSSRAVALTLDDGPDPDVTPQVLEVLEAFGAHATFFVLGERARRYPELLHALAVRGHELGNHGWMDRPAAPLREDEIEREITDTEATLAEIAQPSLYRPGSGFVSKRVSRAAAAHGYRIVLGSAYAFDAHIRNPVLVSLVLRCQIQPGAIIIIHEGKGRRRSVETLKRLLARLDSAGYRTVTVSELLACRR